MVNLLAGLDSPSKSKYTTRAENIDPTGTGHLSGLFSGLKSYYANKGAAEDKENYKQFYDDRVKLQQESDKLNARSNIKGEFLNAISTINSPTFEQDYSPEQQQRLIDFANTRAKGTNTLQSQEEAKSFGKGSGQLRIQPQIDQAEYDVKIANEPLLAEQKAIATKQGQDFVGRQVQARESTNKFDSARDEIAKIKSLIEGDKSLTGIYSAPKQLAGQLTGGRLGFTEEQQEQRGALVRRLNSLGNVLVGMATDAGQSGINVQAEIDRIIKGVNSGASPTELIGSMNALLDQLNVTKGIREKNLNQVNQPSAVTFDDLWGE